MKLNLANKFRGELVVKMMDFLKAEVGDDIGMINSNTVNFPIVVDGEEGWCEIVVKVTKDDGDDGYAKREEEQGQGVQTRLNQMGRTSSPLMG